MPIFTFGTKLSPLQFCALSSPRRLTRSERYAADPFAGDEDVTHRLGLADLGGEIGTDSELANHAEVVLIAGLLCLCVDLAQQLLAVWLRKRCEAAATLPVASLPKHLQSIQN